VFDVAVDIRKNSPTFGRHVTVELTGDNHIQFWIPPGFLHGFVTLEDDTIFTYKVTNFYDKESEIGVIWNDPTLAMAGELMKWKSCYHQKTRYCPPLKIL